MRRIIIWYFFDLKFVEKLAMGSPERFDSTLKSFKKQPKRITQCSTPSKNMLTKTLNPYIHLKWVWFMKPSLIILTFEMLHIIGNNSRGVDENVHRRSNYKTIKIRFIFSRQCLRVIYTYTHVIYDWMDNNDGSRKKMLT